jgi:hypothetical protein
VEPVAIIVAKAKVKGAADIELQPLSEVRVRVKQPVHVKYLYRLEEMSKDKESWRFELASSIGTQQRPLLEARWEDRWGVNDSLWGVLQQEYVFEKPGTYEGSFDVHASHSESSWGSNEVKKRTEKTLNGRFQVRVVK